MGDGDGRSRAVGFRLNGHSLADRLIVHPLQSAVWAANVVMRIGCGVPMAHDKIQSGYRGTRGHKLVSVVMWWSRRRVLVACDAVSSRNGFSNAVDVRGI